MRSPGEIRFYLIDTSSEVPPGHIVPNFIHLLRALDEMGHEVRLVISERFRQSLETELSDLGRPQLLSRFPVIASAKTFPDAFRYIDSDVMRDHVDHSILFWTSWPEIDLDYFSRSEKSVSFSYEIATIANVSNLVRRRDFEAIDSVFLRRAIRVEQIRTIFYWDYLESHQLPIELQSKCRRLKEFHDSVIGVPQTTRLELADIGFFGTSLSAMRGLVEFVWLAYLNPKLQFLASGGSPVWTGGFFRYKSKSHWLLRKICFAFIDMIVGFASRFLANRLHNLVFELRYSPSQLALNATLSRARYVFAAGHIHPYSSGIALQSLALGIPVIWTPGNSAISDQLTVAFADGRLNWRHFLIPGFLTRNIQCGGIASDGAKEMVDWKSFKASLAFGLNLD